jgi:hypothetical protein
LDADLTAFQADVFVRQWIQDKYTKKCYLAKLNHEIVGFATLTKCDFDPFGNRKNVWNMSYIYVREVNRRQSIASQLLQRCKKDQYITCITSSDASDGLMMKNGLKQSFMPGVYHS